MSSPFEFRYLRPLVTRAEVHGTALQCRFTCPVTGHGIDSAVDLSLLPPPQDPPEKSVWSGLRYSVSSALAGVFGTLPLQTAAAGDYGSSEQERGVERAFRSVSALFRWDREHSRWVASDARVTSLTQFEEQLNVHPIRKDNLPTLFRMIAAIAQADGVFGGAERSFLRGFLPHGGPTPEEWASRGRPELEELQQLEAPEERGSALMICWAAALCDAELAVAEQRVAEEFAEELGITPERRAELKSFAQRYLLAKAVEQVLSAFTMNVEEEDNIARVGARLGLPFTETQDVVRRYRERWGLV